MVSSHPVRAGQQNRISLSSGQRESGTLFGRITGLGKSIVRGSARADQRRRGLARYMKANGPGSIRDVIGAAQQKKEKSPETEYRE